MELGVSLCVEPATANTPPSGLHLIHEFAILESKRIDSSSNSCLMSCSITPHKQHHEETCLAKLARKIKKH
jgi:hypothetical protein